MSSSVDLSGIDGTPSGLEERILRLRLTVRGAVQGVGFRPFVYRLATRLGLSGWVSNTAQGILIEVEGPAGRLQAFTLALKDEAPPRAIVQHWESTRIEPIASPGFEIRESQSAGMKTAPALPDGATCSECLAEVLDPGNRRHLYPFTNCTVCGPRFSILLALPYDRPNTTMAGFRMCGICLAEYQNPGDRRFHAQPNACPRCGPHLELWEGTGSRIAAHHEALLQAANAIRMGATVAVKGLGGFHLMVDARSEEAVVSLRRRKSREAKPFALMAPSLAWVRAHCDTSALEEQLLLSPEAPIVLLHRSETVGPALPHPAIAPDNPLLGVMLPYTPLHHLLARELGFAVVATSANRADEPLCTENAEALERLAGIADLFLVHNRPIAHALDDSVVRVVAGRPLLLRRARGYAPLPVETNRTQPSVLATGAHQKNTVALAAGSQVFLSQHIGDLDTAPALEALRWTASGLCRLYEARPRVLACDRHPDYASTRFAEQVTRVESVPLVHVQHHHAHVLACMADNGVEGSVLGVAWDGTGYGDDDTVWGGEFLRVDGATFERRAHLRQFRLPGGDRSAREPRRAAIGLLYELYGGDLPDLLPVRAFAPKELRVLVRMLDRRINAPLTSSAGRLFDAVAALLGLAQVSGFEGQAAMALEFAAAEGVVEESYPFKITSERGGCLIVDWALGVRALLEEAACGWPAGMIAAKLHNTLAEMIVAVAEQIGEPRVALTGGCFQNRYLTERTIQDLRQAGFEPVWHRQVPPNDGGIALGQALAAAARIDRENR